MGWNKQNRLTPVLWKVQNELSTQQQGHLTEGFQFHFYGIWFLSACNMSPVLSTPSIPRQLYKLLFKLHSVLVLGGEKYNWDWTGALKSALKLQFGGHMQGESCPKKQKSFAERNRQRTIIIIIIIDIDFIYLEYFKKLLFKHGFKVKI